MLSSSITAWVGPDFLVSFATTLWKITLRIDDFPAPLRPINSTFCFAAFRFNFSMVQDLRRWPGTESRAQVHVHIA